MFVRWMTTSNRGSLFFWVELGALREHFSDHVLYSKRWKELYVICWLFIESSSRGPMCDVLCEHALEFLLPWDVTSWTSAANTDVHLLVCCRV